MTEEVSKEQIKGENGTGIDEAKRLKEKKGANMVVKRGQNFRRDDEA